jgi:hypothetical protein
MNTHSISGKCSFFGGSTDPKMSYFEGLSFYEHAEADLRPDLFLPKSTDGREGSSKRLRSNQAFYIALRIDGERQNLQGSLWKITNPKTGQFVIGSLVDRGPAESTGRIVDLSDAIGRALRIETDDEVQIDFICSLTS